MYDFTGEQGRSILIAIKENNFLSGNFLIYNFPSQEAFDDTIAQLLEEGFIDYKNPPHKTRDGRIGFQDKEYKLTKAGREVCQDV